MPVPDFQSCMRPPLFEIIDLYDELKIEITLLVVMDIDFEEKAFYDNLKSI